MSKGKDWKVDDQISDAERFRKKGLMAAMVCWCGGILAEHWLAVGILELSIALPAGLRWSTGFAGSCRCHLIAPPLECVLSTFSSQPRKIKIKRFIQNLPAGKKCIALAGCIFLKQAKTVTGLILLHRQPAGSRSSKLKHYNGVKAAYNLQGCIREAFLKEKR